MGLPIPSSKLAGCIARVPPFGDNFRNVGYSSGWSLIAPITRGAFGVSYRTSIPGYKKIYICIYLCSNSQLGFSILLLYILGFLFVAYIQEKGCLCVENLWQSPKGTLIIEILVMLFVCLVYSFWD